MPGLKSLKENLDPDTIDFVEPPPKRSQRVALLCDPADSEVDMTSYQLMASVTTTLRKIPKFMGYQSWFSLHGSAGKKQEPW